MSEPGAGGRHATLEESAAAAGASCWVERRLFEVLGGWAPHCADPAAGLVLDRHAQHAAWRAGQWWDRLPVLAGVDREGLVAAGSRWAGFDEAAAGAGGVDAVRLAVAYRVLLARVAAGYRRRLGDAIGPADGSVARTLRQVHADAAADWSEGEAALQDLLGDGPAVGAAALAVERAERAFLA